MSKQRVRVSVTTNHTHGHCHHRPAGHPWVTAFAILVAAAVVIKFWWVLVPLAALVAIGKFAENRDKRRHEMNKVDNDQWMQMTSYLTGEDHEFFRNNHI